VSAEETLARFRAYVAAFNRGDFDAVTAKYTDDVELVNGAGARLIGKAAIVDFYRKVRADTDRTIEIVECFADDEGSGADLKSEFVATRDAPDFPSGPMAKGDRLRINSFAIYTLRDGKFAQIKAGVHKREWLRA
jgi:ketosteroid isomerase-like protein